MREITIDKNESNQRLDRFLKKYLANATQGFIYKMLRKKNIKLNGNKANPESTIVEGDVIQLYLSDETLDKFMAVKGEIKSKLVPNIIYEDENIILINKPMGILSHGAGGEFEENIVDSMISYLIEKGDYVPRIEKTFTPSICNRLDRNTSGIVIGAKNYQSLKTMNAAIKEKSVRKFYKTIVKGKVTKDFKAEAYLSKDEDRNMVEVTKDSNDDSKKIETHIKLLQNSYDYSLLEIELITGRTHQIRGHLSSLGYPVIGDRKYGNPNINKKFKLEYNLENQWLHGYKVEFNGLLEHLDYLNGKSYEAPMEQEYLRIEEDLF
ncbi:RluA family pseudouridine synthase [Tissierella sp. Yu-01]|uniref:RluA family pseudouridine synthase n=1 Tax=Tissierella sp. Yu-01 TaxID=3035694 RepID=UPI00240D8705|nr:RluA family pseudouridine synthase [Tissierella sp. Yu-01]WFA09398.1 RluA family pseudouridine synthase [Tissierella sp. Yu-01]